jgi:ribose transport system substrate-binding protein
VVSSLPADLQSGYDGFDGFVGKSPWVDFKAKHGPPWTIGYASSYAGNTWRSESLNELEEVLVPKYKEAGLLKEFIVTQSNLNDTTQIEQAHQLIDQGADILLFCCTSTAMVPVIDYAGEHGVPVVTFSGHTDSEYSINLYANYLKAGFDMANFIAQEMGGKGNLLYVNGIPGQASNTSVDTGVHMALKQYPDVNVVGTVSGEWTDQIAKTKVLQFLATHPEPIDGVVVQSAQEVGVMQAFLQSGRELPPMTQGGEKGTACYWKENPDWKTKVFNFWPPADEAEGAMSVMLRILQGQGPKIQSITKQPTTSDLPEVEEQLGSSCSVNDTSWFRAPGWWSEEFLENFFEHPKPVLGG